MTLYLNQNDLNKIGIDWNHTVDTIEKTVRTLQKGDFAQPIKPYLRFRNLNNRIIAMPAYVGKEIDSCGIKWIASFPCNIHKGKNRAHSIVVLNDTNTGEPVSIINTALLSIIRTASISGLVIKYFLESRPLTDINIGIIGWGPIGQYHYKMCDYLFSDRISNFLITDLKKIDPDTLEERNRYKVKIVDNWKEIYQKCEILITCTVSEMRYITGKPIDGALYLNVSLRDFETSVFEYFKNSIIVDDWDEICREQTDVELMHLENGLEKKHTKSIRDIIDKCIDQYSKNTPIMFNPMGMAVFDIAIAKYYYQQAKYNGIGTELT